MLINYKKKKNDELLLSLNIFQLYKPRFIFQEWIP